MLNDLHQHLDLLRLRKIRLIIAEALQEAERKKSSYGAFLLELLRQEVQDQKERSIQNRIRLSGLPEKWTLETYPFHIQKGANKRQHETFAELDFLGRAENLIWIGPSGIGKTGLGSAILLKALLAGRTGRMVKAQDLFDEFTASAADHSTQRLIHRLSHLDVLLIDELGYVTPRPEPVNQLFCLIDKRTRKKSTLITTNLGYQQWPQFLGNEQLTAALLNRLLERAHTITFKNPINLIGDKIKQPPPKEKP